GHTKAAAGAAGLFKAVMALHHKVLPPTIKVTRPNPALQLETTPFYISTRSRPWIRGSAHPRRAGVSSFGFGGSNFHLAVEEYTGANPAARLRTLPSELVTFSGTTVADVITAVQAARDGLQAGSLQHLANVSIGSGGPCRLAVVASDEDDLGRKLDQALAHLRKSPDTALQTPTGISWAQGADPGSVAFLFPGQGSQYLEMGGALAMAFDAARAVWDTAADVTHPVHPVVFPLPRFDQAATDADLAALTRTEWAQPAIGVASLASLALLKDLGVKPATVGGHSFGEITALHAAGALSLADALAVARTRGELMAEAAALPGAMAALPTDIETVREVLEGLDGKAVVANHNAPTQVVISGPTADVERAMAAFVERGIEPKRLNVATAFHSEVVAGSCGPFRKALDKVEVDAPMLPVWANSEAAPYPTSVDAIRELLAGQIARPVRFV
ncbi:MAG: acyltransferase domain-containing protein, partial [Myxococcales bacterium]|nr:acyltransferase domain-containing protein [Myxococcales bacterium]